MSETTDVGAMPVEAGADGGMRADGNRAAASVAAGTGPEARVAAVAPDAPGSAVTPAGTAEGEAASPDADAQAPAKKRAVHRARPVPKHRPRRAARCPRRPDRHAAVLKAAAKKEPAVPAEDQARPQAPAAGQAAAAQADAGEPRPPVRRFVRGIHKPVVRHAWETPDEETVTKGRKVLHRQIDRPSLGPNLLERTPREQWNFALYLKAVHLDGLALKDVPEEERNIFVCEEAVRRDCRAIPYVPANLRQALLRLVIGTIRASFLLHECVTDDERARYALLAAHKGLKIIFIPASLRSLDVYAECRINRVCRRSDIPPMLRDQVHELVLKKREKRNLERVRANNVKAERERLVGIMREKKVEAGLDPD